MNRNVFLISLLIATTAPHTKAAEFSLGVGSEFFMVPELSFPVSDSVSVNINYRVGLISGTSIGLEQSFGTNISAAIVYGVLGSEDPDCLNEQTDDVNLEDIIVDAVVCGARVVLDREPVYGTAMQFTYYFSDASDSGFVLRGELGYGKADYQKQRSTQTGVYLMYRF